MHESDQAPVHESDGESEDGKGSDEKAGNERPAPVPRIRPRPKDDVKDRELNSDESEGFQELAWPVGPNLLARRIKGPESRAER